MLKEADDSHNVELNVIYNGFLRIGENRPIYYPNQDRDQNNTIWDLEFMNSGTNEEKDEFMEKFKQTVENIFYLSKDGLKLPTQDKIKENGEKIFYTKDGVENQMQILPILVLDCPI